jgi:hypothetical protein
VWTGQANWHLICSRQYWRSATRTLYRSSYTFACCLAHADP